MLCLLIKCVGGECLSIEALHLHRSGHRIILSLQYYVVYGKVVIRRNIEDLQVSFLCQACSVMVL